MRRAPVPVRPLRPLAARSVDEGSLNPGAAPRGQSSSDHRPKDRQRTPFREATRGNRLSEQSLSGAGDKASSRRPPRRQGDLGADCADRYDVLGIDGEVLSCLGLDEPRELHNRTPCRVEDGPLDGLDPCFDSEAASRGDGYLRGRAHMRRRPLGRVHVLVVRGMGRSPADGIRG